MALVEIDVRRYGGLGPLNLRLAPGLVVVHGPNEAGKSTLGAFLRYALFGPARGERPGPGDHGGRIRLATPDGEVELSRYNRDAPIMVLPDGRRLEGTAATDFVLGSLDRATYQAIWSFSVRDLAHLKGLGDERLRDRLFSGAVAGAGRSVGAAQAHLAREGRGDGGLNELRRQLDQATAAVAEARARAEGLGARERHRDALDAERAAAATAGADARRAVARLRAWSAALPHHLELRAAERALARLPDGPPVSPVLAERAEALAVDRATARAMVEREGTDAASPVSVSEVAALEVRAQDLAGAGARAGADAAATALRRALTECGVTRDELRRLRLGALEADALTQRAAEVEAQRAPMDARTDPRPALEEARQRLAALDARAADEPERGARPWPRPAALLVAAGIAAVAVAVGRDGAWWAAGALLALAAIVGVGGWAAFAPPTRGDGPRRRQADLALAREQAARREAEAEDWEERAGRLQRARADLRDALRAAGLPEETAAATLPERVRLLRRAIHLDAEASAAEEALAAHQRELAALTDDVRACAARAGLAEPEDVRVTLATLRAQAERATRRAEAQRHLAEVDQRLAAVLAEVGAADLDALRAAVRDGEARREATGRVERARQLRDQALGVHDPAPLDVPDEVGWAEEARAAEEAAADADRRRDQALQQRAVVDHEIDELRASAAVAARDTDRATIAAQLDAARRRHARVALAAALLDRTLERFRAAHQPQILRRASGYVAEATEGAYERIEPVEGQLLLVDRYGRQWPAERLSTGTAELAYLVLRLGLVSEQASRVRLPVVLDDVLANLDPARARGVARLVRAVSREQQVVLLTCRPETRDLMADVVEGVQVVELPRITRAEGD